MSADKPEIITVGWRPMKLSQKKRSRASKAAAFMQLSADHKQSSLDKKGQNRKRMRVVHLERQLQRKEEQLRAFPKFQPPTKTPRPKGPLRPDEWKLKGAARPAAMLARIEAGELYADGDEMRKPVETFDLLKQMQQEGTLAINPNTREYLSILRQLAEACCQAAMPDRGIKHYKYCIKLDKQDTLQSRVGLACALIDDGRGDEANELIKKYGGVGNSAILAYCLVIIAYVSWEVLEEKDASEEKVRDAFLTAYKLNPFIAVFISAHETFLSVVEYVEDIKDPPPGSIEESFFYCANNIGVWLDTVGAAAWIEKEMVNLDEPKASSKDCMDEMYLGMYETAVEMHKEALAEDDGEDEENGSE